VADKKVSLIIVAKDAASATIKATGAAISKIASGITGAFKMAGGVAHGLNSALEVTKKVLGLVGAAFDATVGRALEVRAVTDGARQDMDALTKATDGLQVAIGNALIPVVQTLAQVLTPLLLALTGWFDRNRALIASSFIQWITKAASVVVDVLTPAIQAALVVNRLFMVQFEALAALVKDVGAGLSAVFSGVQSAIEKASQIPGFDVLAKSASDAGSSIMGTFDRAGGWVKQKLGDALNSVPGVAAMGRLGEAAQKALGEVAVAGANNATAAIKRASTAVRTLKGDADGAYQAWLAFNQATAKTQLAEGVDDLSRALRTAGTEYARLAQNAEATDALEQGLKRLKKEYGAAGLAAFEATGSIAGASAMMEEQGTKIDTIRDAVGSVISSIGSAFTGMIDAAIDGTKSASDIIGGFFGSIGRSILDTIIGIAVQFAATKLTEVLLGSLVARTAITNYAAQAGAAAFASTAAIPIIGPLLAPGAATAAYAGAIAFQGLAMAEGGLVTGGIVGQDSVPAMMMPGEYVVPAAQVRQNVAAGRAPDDSGSARGGSGGRGVTVVNNFAASTFADSPANMERKATTAARTFQRVARRAVGIG
jgi:hypothetical protein